MNQYRREYLYFKQKYGGNIKRPKVLVVCASDDSIRSKKSMRLLNRLSFPSASEYDFFFNGLEVTEGDQVFKEDFRSWTTDHRFDIIINESCTFDLITPETIEKIDSLLTDSGVYVSYDRKPGPAENKVVEVKVGERMMYLSSYTFKVYETREEALSQTYNEMKVVDDEIQNQIRTSVQHLLASGRWGVEERGGYLLYSKVPRPSIQK